MIISMTGSATEEEILHVVVAGGLYVATAEPILPHNLTNSLRKLVLGEWDAHAINFGRIKEAIQVGIEPEDSRAVCGFVTPYALKHSRSAVKRVRRDVYGGLTPQDHRSIRLDPLRLFEYR